MMSVEDRKLLALDQLVKNAGPIFDAQITRVPPTQLQMQGKPQDPTGTKIGIDPQKLLKKLGGSR